MTYKWRGDGRKGGMHGDTTSTSDNERAALRKRLDRTQLGLLAATMLFGLLTQWAIRNSDSLASDPLPWMLGLVALLFLECAAGMILFRAVRGLRGAEDIRRPAFAALFGGFLVFSLLAGSAVEWWGNDMLLKKTAQLSAHCVSEECYRQAFEDSSQPVEVRSALSRAYAWETYRNTGERIAYLALDGARTRFEPTDEEVKTRAASMEVREVLARAMTAARIQFVLTLFVTALSLALGLLTPIPHPPEAACQ